MRSVVAAVVSLVFVNTAHADIVATGGTVVVDSNFTPTGQALGPGDTDVSPNQVYVSNGSLSVTGGSKLTTGVFVQAGLGANSTVVIDGNGSQVLLNRAQVAGGQFGHDSAPGFTANMSITNGGSLVIADPNGLCGVNQCFIGQIGNAAGTTANVTVSGANSLLDLDMGTPQTVIIGDTGVFTNPPSSFNFGVPGGATTSNVTVSDGGRMDTGLTYVAWGGGAQDGNGNESVTATVTVTGANSVWNADTIRVGYHRTDELAPNTSGTVIVANGGTINAANGVYVGAGGLLGGNGQVNGFILNQGGVVKPGLSPGTLEINGNAFFQAGVLEIEIGGTGAGLFDVLKVNGGAYFGASSSILFKFVSGFAPQQDDVFDFLSATDGIFLDQGMSFLTEGLQDGFLFDVGFDEETGAFGLRALNDGVAVPEPGTLALLGLGLAGLGLSRRRRVG